MASIFTQIIAGEIPCFKVAESANCLAFLDINPLAKGHVLVIPKVEVDNIFDLDDTTYSELHLFAKNIAIAMKKAIPCTKIGITVIGLEVPHAHIHLIPINKLGDMNFSNKKLNFSKEELSETAKLVAAFL